MDCPPRAMVLSPAPVPTHRCAGRRRALAAALLLVATLARGGPAAAAGSGATLIDLGAFFPDGVNAHGVVVGDVVDHVPLSIVPHAAVWANGTLTRLPESDGTTESEAFAVNDAGRVVGLEFVDDSVGVHAVYWDGTAGPTQIARLFPGSDFSSANAVDTAGDVVGFTTAAPPRNVEGFYAAAGGAPVPVGVGNLDADRGGTYVGAITPDGATLLGQVVNTTGSDGYYLWSSADLAAPGIKLDLTPPTNGFTALSGSGYNPLVIQDDLASDGSVLGFKGTGASRTWYLRTPDGSETPIVGLTGGSAVNAKHVVAGTIFTGTTFHAAIWDAATQTVTDLNTLLPANSGTTLLYAFAINDNGDIVGRMTSDKGFLLRIAGLAATIAPDPPDPALGETFTLTITATNSTNAPMQNVTPPSALTVAGAGKATLKSGPIPASVAKLAAGASAMFTYTFEATGIGAMVFAGDVQATGAGGPTTATARCGLGSSALRRVRAATGPTCPADGNGATVAIQPCRLRIESSSETDSKTGTTYLDGDVTLTQLAGDSFPPQGNGYPSGGT